LAEDLFAWSKYSNFNVYRTKVLRPLDNENLIEYDRESESAILSPLGVKRVEEEIIGRTSKPVAKPKLKKSRVKGTRGRV
jgi:hypothetical protein